jgi:Flp pilus assembly protein TadB
VTGVSVPTVLAASLLAGAVALALPGRTAAGEPWVEPRGAPRGGPVGVTGPVEAEGAEDPLRRHRALLSVLAGVAPLVVLGGAVGAVAGVLVAIVVHRTLGAREPARERRRREAITRELPLAVDLLGVALVAGAAPSSALAAVAAATDGPLAAELRAAEHGLRLGRDPARVWQEVGRRPGLAGLGRAMVRAVETGASVSETLHRLADDLHGAAGLEAESRARTVGVRATAPMGLCLLPAFALVGVVPLVAGAVTSLLGP